MDAKSDAAPRSIMCADTSIAILLHNRASSDDFDRVTQADLAKAAQRLKLPAASFCSRDHLTSVHDVQRQARILTDIPRETHD